MRAADEFTGFPLLPVTSRFPLFAAAAEAADKLKVKEFYCLLSAQIFSAILNSGGEKNPNATWFLQVPPGTLKYSEKDELFLQFNSKGELDV